jgi:copper homeostasis protein
VLTSGAQASAVDGAAQIRALLAQASGRVAVMPGAGVDARNIATLARATGASEFHASAKRQRPSRMQHRRVGLEDMAAGEWRTDAAEVSAMVAALEALASGALHPP